MDADPGNPENQTAGPGQMRSVAEPVDHGRIVSVSDRENCLDILELERLEKSFRKWARDCRRADVGLSRQRILIIFLLIRYTGAKLSEVLALDPYKDLDPRHKSVVFRGADPDDPDQDRRVRISESLFREIREALADPGFKEMVSTGFHVDPGFVRRKFYLQAEACGFPRKMGGPETIRKARAVELMRGNMPLPAVQMMLGHSTPNLTSAYVTFSRNEIQQVIRLYMERESFRKTSARNAFFGKIRSIRTGDIQTLVELTTMGGHSVSVVITNRSLALLGLKKGRLVTAEIKSPWVILHKGEKEPECSAENRFPGTVFRITPGALNTEFAVRLSDGTQLCATISTESGRRLNLGAGDRVWAVFSCYAAVLHLD